MAILDKVADFGIGTVQGAWNDGWRTVRNTAMIVGGIAALVAGIVVAGPLGAGIGVGILAGALFGSTVGLASGLFAGQYGAAFGALTGGFKKVASRNAERDQNLELEQGAALQEHSAAIKRIENLPLNRGDVVALSQQSPAQQERAFASFDKGSAQKEAPEPSHAAQVVAQREAQAEMKNFTGVGNL